MGGTVSNNLTTHGTGSPDDSDEETDDVTRKCRVGLTDQGTIRVSGYTRRPSVGLHLQEEKNQTIAQKSNTYANTQAGKYRMDAWNRIYRKESSHSMVGSSGDLSWRVEPDACGVARRGGDLSPDRAGVVLRARVRVAVVAVGVVVLACGA